MGTIETTLFDEKISQLESRIDAIGLASNIKLLSIKVYPGTYNGKYGHWAELVYVIINPEREIRKYLRH